jgi:hypothetical protein
MVEDASVQENKVILVYGKQFGWVDVGNVKEYLDRHCCTDCWLYLETAPVERVESELEGDSRIQVRITKNPKKAAKAYMEELKAEGAKVEMKRLEEVSDRSISRGGC